MVDSQLRIALFQPDIAQNTGTILRLCACLGLKASIIEPAGFPVSDRHFRRAGMDYLDAVDVLYHPSWTAFETFRHASGQQPATGARPRLILMTTKASLAYTDFSFVRGDILLAGRESAGVPDSVHAAADARLSIPMRPDLRSLNVAVAVAMVVGEAIRQIQHADPSQPMSPCHADTMSKP
jgi:tRNA (cytidine/uridine-2'-O-)-methyltransferase